MKIQRSGRFYVYIVECRDRTYYTGYTNDLENRVKEHNNGKRGAKYLRGKAPVKLVYAKEYRYYKNALRAERDIKKRTRKEKEVMVSTCRKNVSPQIYPLSADKSIRGDGNQRCE